MYWGSSSKPGHACSSSSSAPVLLAVKKGKDIKELFVEYGIPEGFAGYFHVDADAPKDNKIEAEDLKDDYDFYFAYITMTDWGEGDLAGEDFEPWDDFVQRDDEMSRRLRLHDQGRKERENLVRDELILLYVGVEG